jgi:hypothetical protein
MITIGFTGNGYAPPDSLEESRSGERIAFTPFGATDPSNF